jgi:hypothetical protein
MAQNMNQPKTSNPMQGVFAAASIAQERVTKEVRYAVTGDPEIDFVAGVVATFYATQWSDAPMNHLNKYEMAARVCEYLSKRFHCEGQATDQSKRDSVNRELDQRVRMIEQLTRMQQQKNAEAAPLPQPEPPSWPYTLPYTTTTNPPPGFAGMADGSAEDQKRDEYIRTARAFEESLKQISADDDV